MENTNINSSKSNIDMENNIENNNINIADKVKGNAISAYLFICFAWLFFFNKTNNNINNDFVKTHTKTATIIHLGFLITYIIFISNSLFASIIFYGFGLNDIITIIIYLFLLGLLVLGIYKSNKGLEFSISKDINISSKKSILDINGDGEVTEKEKLTILLAFIPLIGFVNFSKYKDNETIQNATRVNIIITLIITLLYIFSYSNLVNLFSLTYIILITFIGINLFTRNELLSIRLTKYLSPENTYILLYSIKDYLKNYFNDSEFENLETIINKNTENCKKIEQKNEFEIKSKKEFKLPKFLIYIPFINLIFLFFKDTKYSFHIRNGITITIILLISLVLEYFGYYNTSFNILLLFPILFGIGYTNNRIAYEMPVIYDIYIFYSKIIGFLQFSKKTIKEKRAIENEISLKVKI